MGFRVVLADMVEVRSVGYSAHEAQGAHTPPEDEVSEVAGEDLEEDGGEGDGCDGQRPRRPLWGGEEFTGPSSRAHGQEATRATGRAATLWPEDPSPRPRDGTAKGPRVTLWISNCLNNKPNQTKPPLTFAHLTSGFGRTILKISKWFETFDAEWTAVHLFPTNTALLSPSTGPRIQKHQ